MNILVQNPNTIKINRSLSLWAWLVVFILFGGSSIAEAEERSQNPCELLDPYETYHESITELSKLIDLGSVNTDISSKLNYYQCAMSLAIRFENKEEEVRWQLKLSAVYIIFADFESAMEHALPALEKALALNIRYYIIKAHNNLGNLYHFAQDYTKAEMHFRKALEVSPLDQRHRSMAGLANLFRIQKQYDSALYYLDSAIAIGRENSSKNEINFLLRDMSKLYHAMGWHQRSYDLHLECLETAKQQKNKYGISGSLVEISLLLIDMEQYQKAKEYALEGLALAQQIHNKEHQKELSKVLYEASFELAEFDQAKKYIQQYEQLKDSIFSREKAKLMANMETRFNVKTTRQELMLTRQQNSLKELKINQYRYGLLALAIFLIFSLLIAVLLIKQSRLKHQQHAVQLEQKLLRLQMNPHFIFNSLISIQSILYEQNLDKAEKYLTRFSKLVRMILNNSRDELISLEREIKTLTYYMEMNKLRFFKTLHYRIDVDPEIDIHAVQIPPMFAQPFLENAIEYGNSSKEENIFVNFKRVPEGLQLSVEDQGQAEPSDTFKKNRHKPLATRITRERIHVLNRNLKHKIRFTIQTKSSGGTLVQFIFPNSLITKTTAKPL